ncbi:MAG TPA: OsmC family protein [Chryseolinea sp.]|nr:OsmC family protein [Chryseolinea sp.]
MNSNELKSLQEPLKNKYKSEPGAALITLKAKSKFGDGVTCKIETGKAMVEAGLHPATGGDGLSACSGDMLLEALAACAGVTLNAVATAIEFPLRDASIYVEGDLDFRGTLSVDRDVPVGFKNIRLKFDLDTDADADRIDKLIKLTERYCVVLQTLSRGNQIEVSVV